MATESFGTKDTVSYTCPVCMDETGNANAQFSLVQEITAGEAKEHENVTTVDLQTFMSVTEITDTASTRMFACDECDQHILFFPESGSQYIV